eukprot:COSAG04_NODE_18252_length_447_cov_1.043103_1_plen_83_part_10
MPWYDHAALIAKGAEGTLAAGAPRRAPPNFPCPLTRVAAALANPGRHFLRTPLHSAAMCTQPGGAAAGGVRLLLAAGADATVQ